MLLMHSLAYEFPIDERVREDSAGEAGRPSGRRVGGALDNKKNPQTFMFCALSGTSPARPVVSVKSGHVFEASAIEKYISSTGKCPVTGQPLQAADLLPLKTTSAKSRHLAAMSIPGMMTLFQDEWDGLILETYALKQQVCYHDDQPELCLLTPCPCSFCHLGGYYAPGAWPRALPA